MLSPNFDLIDFVFGPYAKHEGIDEMNLNKDCSCCGRPLTTKNVITHGSQVVHEVIPPIKVLWFSCKACRSTMILKRKLGEAPSEKATR